MIWCALKDYPRGCGGTYMQYICLRVSDNPDHTGLELTALAAGPPALRASRHSDNETFTGAVRVPCTWRSVQAP